jgi:hypothetical protein
MATEGGRGLAQSAFAGALPPQVGVSEPARIAINRIKGPLTFKYALDRIGDSGRAP